MIFVLGVKHDIDIKIREKLSIISKRLEDATRKLGCIFNEAVVISTCNRTEIYYRTDSNTINNKEDIFEAIGWDKGLLEYTFHLDGMKAIVHLMEVICGFDSIVLGEDQILGQIKEAYEIALKLGTVKSSLLRLFQMAVTCGKEFRSESELYKIPVSTASIVIREAKRRGIKRFMIIGYGEIGSLVSKYVLADDYEKLYIAVRDVSSVDLDVTGVEVVNINEKSKYYSDVDCIISATSAPHTVVKASELPSKNLLIFDMAVPRDVEDEVCYIEGIDVYNIDKLYLLQDENYNVRKERMNNHRHIVDKYIDNFMEWEKLKELSQSIRDIKEHGQRVYLTRANTFKNKRYTKDNEKLAEVLLKSTANAYINRAIEVLKEEHLKGRGDECMRIIEKIFMPQK
jgi:glutamyl-tRNA reductase